jgi:hypothetical protein
VGLPKGEDLGKRKVFLDTKFWEVKIVVGIL